MNPAEGAEAAAIEGDDSSQPQDRLRADAQRLGPARQTVEEGLPTDVGLVEPATEVEGGKVPIVHEEEAEYRSKFGDLIHILKIAA